MWSVLSFCYTLLVILQKNRVNTLNCWTRQISMDMTAEERKRTLAPEDELWCWLCASWDTTFLRRTLPRALVWIRALCQDYTAAGWKFWKHASMSFPLGRTRLRFRKSVPATFKNLYPDTCVIIDSAEIETDRSHNPILSLWRGSTTSVELSRAASFIHSQVHCNEKACEGVHIFDNFDSSFRGSTSKKK